MQDLEKTNLPGWSSPTSTPAHGKSQLGQSGAQVITACNSRSSTGIRISAEDQARLLRKIDWQLLPILTMLYLLSFLDRASIGNAKIANMGKDLHLTPGQYNIAVSVALISYACFEVPSNIILKLSRPSIWLPSICLAWGIVTICTGFVQNFTGLVVLRLLLGFAEGGFFPGVVYLLTIWYPRHAVVFRFTLFFSGASLAAALGGLMARGLVAANGAAGLSGWRWIFIIEGLITIVISLVAYFVIQDSPLTSRFLSQEDRTLLQALMDEDSLNESKEFSWAEVRAALQDVKVYLGMAICIGLALPAYSFAFFLPSIINLGLGFKATEAQLLSVPPFFAAFIFTLGAGWFSDSWRSRGIPMLCFTFLAMPGYILEIFLPQDHNMQGVKYFSTFLCIVGIGTALALGIPWLGNNLRGHTYRAVGGAAQLVGAQLGGIAGSYIYREKDAPGYHFGHGICLVSLVVAAAATVVQRWHLKRENDKMDKKEAEGGDKSPFRYTL